MVITENIVILAILAAMLAASAVLAFAARRMRKKWIPATLISLLELSAAGLLLMEKAPLSELFLVLLVFLAVTFTVQYPAGRASGEGKGVKGEDRDGI